jgi:type VI secretion system protein VasG
MTPLDTLLAACNPVCQAALARADVSSRQWGHGAIEPAHLMLALLNGEPNDLACLLPVLGLQAQQMEQALRNALQALPAAAVAQAAGVPVLSQSTVRLLREAWLVASIDLGGGQLRSGALLLAVLEQPALCQDWPAGAAAALTAQAADLRLRFDALAEASCEQPAAAVLAQYAQDLTAQARAGRIDPVCGRDGEIRQAIDILLRRRQNSPILVGEPGVGKTAIVEGLALRIAAGEVPPALRKASIWALDLALLQAGAGTRGQFEQRLQQVIAAVRGAPAPVILFIDEAHTLIGAGGAAGQGDAANLLKPPLARGELRAIAATSWVEYKKYVEKDAALARRFQLLRVGEPDEGTALAMLRGVALRLEQHHGVSILDAALRDAVKLSHRYLSGRQLPDKAISVLDTACARVALEQHHTPPQVAALGERIATLEGELLVLRREAAAGAAHAERIAEADAEQRGLAAALGELSVRWREEQRAVRDILALRHRLAEPGSMAEDDDDAAPELLSAQLRRLEAGLEVIRQDEAMVPVCVDSATVAAVIAAWTGIPVGKMLADQHNALRSLHERLAQRVIGQEQALSLIADRIKAYHAGLADPNKPVGCFLLAGPSGVGKTETAYALADALYGGERNVIAVNLSEYQESHTVSQLRGAPPGYVGHGSGGVLTEAVRRNPYSVVLLDEFEKAHADVQDAFYNVFDKGGMEDGTGLQVDFRNTVILATSNAGVEAFRPALLARLAVVPYRPLDGDAFRRIAASKLATVAERAAAADPDFAGFGDDTVDWIVERCCTAGAREIDNVIATELLPPIAERILDSSTFAS